MKKILAAILAFSAISCNSQEKIELSKEALSTTLLSVDNKTQIAFDKILKQHDGKTVVIELWASWCSDCVKAMPLIKDLQARYLDVDYVFLSFDKTADKWQEGIKKHNLIGHHYMVNDGMKGVFGKALTVDWIPSYIVVDKTGKIVLYRATEEDFYKVEKEIEKNN
jgi:thiol-disulfide isomerase/thioredoxin